MRKRTSDNELEKMSECAQGVLDKGLSLLSVSYNHKYLWLG